MPNNTISHPYPFTLQTQHDMTQFLPISAAALSLLLLFATCRPDKEEPPCPSDLPCATQTGENTMGCYINGKPWEAKVELNVLDPTAHEIEASYDETGYGTFNNNYCKVLGAYHGDSLTFMALHFSPIKNIGIIKLDSLNFYRVLFKSTQHYYYLDPNSPFEINITKLDTANNILSGTYYFKGITDNLKDTLNFTDGRFDVRYYQE
jgi:hypothetical protein